MTRAILAGCTVLMLAAGAASQKPKLEVAESLLQAAIKKEVVDGNLAGAIEDYKKALAAATNNRSVAANALYRLADCYTKQGNAEARRTFERLVREYADQPVAAEARARLAALGGGNGAEQQAMRLVWNGPKVDPYESSISPDARFITFPDWDTGNLGLHDLISGTDRDLTSNGTYKFGDTAFAEASAISRDGKQVAYAWYDDKIRRYELRVLSLNGDPNPTRVFSDPNVTYLEPREWSPDGKWIAANLYDKKNAGQMGLINVQDGSLHVLKFGTGRTDNPLFGGFSPDGKYVVYTRNTPGGSDRGYVLSVDGKSEMPLVSGSASAKSPVWTPEGSRIVFVSDRSGTPSLWHVRVVDGKPQDEPELLKAGFSYAPMGFTRNGSLYYDVSAYATDIYVAGLDPGTGRLRSGPKRVNERVGNSWGRVAWLPDGKSLSYWNRAPVSALVEHNMTTGEEREIWGGKSGRPIQGYNGWFPDGRTIMARGDLAKSLKFYRVDSWTGEVQATWTIPALPPGASQAVPSPDLMTIYFLRKNDTVPCGTLNCTYIMFARDLRSGRDREVFRIGEAIQWRISISPDGHEMAVIASDGPVNRILIAPTTGGAPREIYRGDTRFLSTAWTRDGRHVLGFPLGGGEVWSIPATGGAPAKSPIRLRVSEAAAVSPDGTQIALVASSHMAEIWVMTGLFKDSVKGK